MTMKKSQLTKSYILKKVSESLKEDFGSRGDITSNALIPRDHKSTGTIISNDTGWTLTYGASGKLRFYTANGSNLVDASVQGYISNQWVHCVVERYNGRLTFYQNGAAVGDAIGAAVIAAIGDAVGAGRVSPFVLRCARSARPSPEALWLRGSRLSSLRAHSSTANGATGQPILDPGTTNLSQAGDEARGQTGPRDHGTTRAHRTGPPGHRFWICRAMILSQAGDLSLIHI